MNTYRIISLSFWTDSKIDDDFTPEDKYFYFYLLTNPHTNLCGCYEVGMKQMCRETGYNEDTIHRLLDRMEHQHRVIRYCAETKEVLILNWSKYNWNNSMKTLSGVLNSAKSIKATEFRAFIAEKLEALGVNADTLSIGYAYPMDTSVTDTVSDSVSDTVPEEDHKEKLNTKDNARARAREESKEAERQACEQFEGELRNAFSEWLIYKRQKRQSYQEQGLKTLINRIKSYAEKYGDLAVASVIRDSMSSNYAGITFDRLDKSRSGAGRGGGTEKPFRYDYGNDADTLPF